MKLTTSICAVVLGVLAAVSVVPVARQSAQAAPVLVVNTSFDCPEWVQNSGVDPCGIGDPIKSHGGWTGHSGQLDQITSAANNPLGTGRGLRHYRGQGVNNLGGGVAVDIPPTMQVWLRVYMRFSAGFAWQYDRPQYTKDVYWNVGVSDFRILGFSGDYFYTHIGPGSQNIHSSDTWAAINGGPKGDGKFHSYEQYMKIDTNGSNGELKLWRDGNLVLSRTGLNLGGGTLRYFALGENQSYVIGDHYTDYDDLAVSFTGYIGPIGGAAAPQPTGPAAPTNLRITN